MRLKFPAGYRIAPHWHPIDERVTVISGSARFGLGERFEESKARNLPAGSFIALPAKTPHFVHVTEETVVQLNTTGPWSLTYVNPDDDPRKKKDVR
jgi:quercetin dioxygenase-like cupin family protein